MRKFSIIVPVYNTKKEFFEECVESIKKQSYDKYEVIIVDDGSKKEYRENYCKIVKADNRFSIYSQNNLGVSVARNRGVQHATGDYILFVDADDWVEPDLLEKMNEIIDFYKNKCELILFQHYTEQEEYKKQSIRLLDLKDKSKLIQRLMDENNWLNEESNLRHFGAVWNKCYKRKYIIDNFIKLEPDIKYSEDVLYSIKSLFLANNIIYTTYPLYNYRIYGNSTFDKYNKNANLDFLAFIRSLKRLLIELELYKSMYQAYLIKVYTSYQFVMTLKFFCKNREGIFDLNSWKKFNHEREIAEMLSAIDLSNLNLKGKIVVFCAKHDLFMPIRLIYALKKDIRC